VAPLAEGKVLFMNYHNYFHDRFILFILAVNSFLTIASVSTIFLRLGDTENTYIQAYRSNLGLNAFSSGEASEIISFAVFAVLIFVGHILIGIKLHEIRKHASWITMAFGTLLLVLTLIISNALLQLR
jgi:hypothetical protein